MTELERLLMIPTPVRRTRRTRMRDTQRSKLYNAERAAPRGRELATVAALQRRTDEIWYSAFRKKHWPRADSVAPRILDGRGRRSACYAPGEHTISMPLWARFERVLLHEIAHALAPRKAAWHGAEFAAILVRLMSRFIGIDAAKALKASFKAARVRTRPKTPRVGNQPKGVVPPGLARWRQEQLAAKNAAP